MLVDVKVMVVLVMIFVFIDLRLFVVLVWNKNNVDYGWFVIEYFVVKLWISLFGLMCDVYVIIFFLKKFC